MYRTLVVMAFSFLAVTILFHANADDSGRHVDADPNASPEVSEKGKERIPQLRMSLRRGAEQFDGEAAQLNVDNHRERITRKFENDLLRRFHSDNKELDEDELREVVRILVGRVLRLEDEVRLLREAPPRVELLR